MDYWTFDGWFALQRRLREADAPSLTKTVFPGIELRLAAPMKGRLNAHVLFSDQIDDQVLRDFLSNLTLELANRPLSDAALKLPSPRFASTNYAAGAIGIRPSVLSSRAAAGKIPGRRIHAKGRTLFVVDMEAIRSIRFSRFEDVAMPRALRMLGVSVAIYRPLRKDGDIPSDHVPTRPGGLAREDLLAFRSSIMSMARKAPAGVRLYSFGAFLEGPTPASVKIDCLRRIKSGQIAVYHRRSKSTFKDLLTKQDLVLESRDARVPTFGSGQMSMCDLMARHGLNDYEANAVVGHLTHDQKAKHRKTASEMDVTAFMKKYRPLRRVAEELGVAVATMHAIARHNECRECMLVLRHGLSKSRRSDLAYFVDRRFEGRARKILRRLGLPRRAGGTNPATNLPRSRTESRTRSTCTAITRAMGMHWMSFN